MLGPGMPAPDELPRDDYAQTLLDEVKSFLATKDAVSRPVLAVVADGPTAELIGRVLSRDRLVLASDIAEGIALAEAERPGQVVGRRESTDATAVPDQEIDTTAIGQPPPRDHADR